MSTKITRHFFCLMIMGLCLAFVAGACTQPPPAAPPPQTWPSVVTSEDGVHYYVTGLRVPGTRQELQVRGTAAGGGGDQPDPGGPDLGGLLEYASFPDAQPGIRHRIGGPGPSRNVRPYSGNARGAGRRQLPECGHHPPAPAGKRPPGALPLSDLRRPPGLAGQPPPGQLCPAAGPLPGLRDCHSLALSPGGGPLRRAGRAPRSWLTSLSPPCW